jgi:hypothetical protein
MDGFMLKDADGHTVSPITQYYEPNHPNLKYIHKYMAACSQPGVAKIIESGRIQELCAYLDSNPLPPKTLVDSLL